METQSKTIQASFIRFFSTCLGCIIIGLIFFRLRIFNPQDWAFDFIQFGVLAAIFYALLCFITLRNSIAAYFVLTLISVIILPKPYDLYFSLFWNLLEHIFICIAVYLYWRFPYSGKKAVWIRPLQLAGYFMIAWALVSVALRVYANWYEGFFLVVYQSLRHGLLIGLGLGAGIEAGNVFLTRFFKPSTSL